MSNVNQEALSYLSEAGSRGGVPRAEAVEIIASFVQFFFSLIGVLCLVYLLWAGYQFVSSHGDSEKVNSARSTLKNGLIGLIIILGAYAISSFVTTKVQQLVGGRDLPLQETTSGRSLENESLIPNDAGTFQGF